MKPGKKDTDGYSLLRYVDAWMILQKAFGVCIFVLAMLGNIFSLFLNTPIIDSLLGSLILALGLLIGFVVPVSILSMVTFAIFDLLSDRFRPTQKSTFLFTGFILISGAVSFLYLDFLTGEPDSIWCWLISGVYTLGAIMIASVSEKASRIFTHPKVPARDGKYGSRIADRLPHADEPITAMLK